MIFRHSAHLGQKDTSTQNSRNPTRGRFVVGLCAKKLWNTLFLNKTIRLGMKHNFMIVIC